jgi:hypothetical protein
METFDPKYANEPTWKARLLTKKDKEKAKLDKVIFWAKNNPEQAITVAGIVASLGGTAIKMASNKKVKDERKRIDTTYYDPRTGMHWELRKKPDNYQREYIEEHREYEPMGKILRDLNLTK